MQILRVLFLLLMTMGTASFAGPNAKLAEAKKHADDLDLEGATKLLDAALLQPGNDRQTLLDVYELQGVAWATLGKAEKARDAFRALLVLDPEHKLPGNQPPRVRTPFYEAKDWALTRGTLKLEPSSKVAGGVVASLSVKVSGDSLAMARAVVFRVEGAAKPQVVPVKPGPDVVATAPVSAARVKWSAELVGDRDAVLASLPAREDTNGAAPVAAVADVPKAGAGALTPAPGPEAAAVTVAPANGDASGGLRKLSFGLLAVGGAALLAGGVVGYQVVDAQSQLDGAARNGAGVITGLTQKQAQALDQRARGAAPIANGLLGAGAVLAAAGFTLFFVSAPAAEAPVAAAVGPGGVTVAGRF